MVQSILRTLVILCIAFTQCIAADKPNIIIVLTDDMGMGDLGCYGGTIEPTPNFNRLASEGIRFTQYYAASPICSPSRAGLITGMWPAQWRITSFLQTRAGNRGCEQVDFLSTAAPTLPRRLKSVGYRTAHFGKWHLGGGRDVKNAPKFAAYGYDEHASTYESPEPHPDITATNWIWSDKDKVKRWDRTAFFVDRTLDFLRRHPDQPCFVNLWLDDPHTPWVPEAGAPKRDSLKNLRGVLAENDRQIGRLLEGLKAIGADANTLVIFASDNGPMPTFDRTRNVGLRASKLSLYEGGIRMPLLARWPGKIPAGRVDEQTVLAAVDLFPTLAKIAGAELPKRFAFSGEEMSGALFGTPVAARKAPLFWEYGRNDKWFRYPRNADDRSPNVAMREGEWKLLINADGTGAELYNVVTDKEEKTNVAEQHPDVVKKMSDQALAWRKEQSAPEPVVNNDGKLRPNIVVFISDDLSVLDTTPYGAREVRTPNMQRLATQGMTFTHAFVASPGCAPSRAALLTGLMPARNGAEPNHSKARADIKKLPAYFRELGYEIAAFGKVAHYGHGKHYGFDDIRFEGFHDYRGIPAAVEFLENRDPAKPLCLFVGTNWPHRPWPKEYGGYEPGSLSVSRSQVDTPVTRNFLARYYHAVTKADDDLGIIHDAAAKHLSKDTLFLFSSDHGAQWPFGKWNCYDAGVRVPLIVTWPGVVKPGSRSSAMVSWIDFLPTLLEAAGGNPPQSGFAKGQIDGRSFLGVLRGEKPEHRDRIFTTHSGDGEMNIYPIRSVRTRDWKYIRNLHPEFQYTTHVDRAKQPDETSYWVSWVERATTDKNAAEIVRRYQQRPAEELYDLEADPLELNNLAEDSQQAERLASLSGELDAWMQEQGDQRKVFNTPVLLNRD